MFFAPIIAGALKKEKRFAKIKGTQRSKDKMKTFRNDLKEMRSYLLLWFTQLISGLGSAISGHDAVQSIGEHHGHREFRHRYAAVVN